MNKKRYFILIILIGVIFLVLLPIIKKIQKEKKSISLQGQKFPEMPVAKLPEQEKCLKIKTDIVNSIETFAKKYGFPNRIEHKESHTFIQKYDPIIDENEIVYWDEKNRFEIVYAERQNSYIDSVTSGRAFEFRKNLFDHPPEPKWNKEKAIQIAKEYVEIILGKFPQNVMLKEIIFKECREGKNFKDGRWYIRWQRIDSKGRFFDRDHIAVYIYEDFGPNTFFNELRSVYEEKDTPIIEKEKALKLFPEYVTRLRSWKKISKIHPDLALKGELTATLKIIIPNANASSDYNLADTHAKLAWQVAQVPYLKDTLPKDMPMPLGKYFAVWIDAETGDFLGGLHCDSL